MKSSFDKVELEALNLSNEERAFLVDRLLSSLGGETLSDVDLAWVAEAENRYAQYKAGIRQPVPADDVFADADRITRLASRHCFYC